MPECLIDIEPDTIVGDGQGEPFRASTQMHGDFVRLTVLEGVLQRFLNDSEHAHREIGRQRRWHVVVGHGDGGPIG